MSWAMASVKLKDNHAQISDIGVNGFLVRRPKLMYTDHSWISR